MLVLGLGSLPMAPAEHVHEATGHDGHHKAVAHRHTAPHAVHAAHHDDVGARGRADEADQGRATPPAFDDDDSVVVTLDPVFVGSRPFAAPPPALVVTRVVVPPDARGLGRPAPFVERLIHGPPRAPTFLRGPPSPAPL